MPTGIKFALNEVMDMIWPFSSRVGGFLFIAIRLFVILFGSIGASYGVRMLLLITIAQKPLRKPKK